MTMYRYKVKPFTPRGVLAIRLRLSENRLMMEKLTTRVQYDEVKARVEQLIAEATAKGLLEPDMDNDYTREISLLSQQMAAYEDR